MVVGSRGKKRQARKKETKNEDRPEVDIDN